MNTIEATNIIFLNTLATLDETQFDTTDRTELAQLWWDFCIENHIIEIYTVNVLKED